MLKVRGAIAIIVACGVATGCTSADDKSNYIESVDEIQSSAIDTYNQTLNATPTNPKAQAEQLAAAEATLGDIVAELEALDVPEDATAGHQNLVAGYDDLRELFADAAANVRDAKGPAESFEAVEAIGAEGAAVAESIDQAISQINEDLGAN
jgi:hypothetical protein